MSVSCSSSRPGSRGTSFHSILSAAPTLMQSATSPGSSSRNLSAPSSSALCCSSTCASRSAGASVPSSRYSGQRLRISCMGTPSWRASTASGLPSMPVMMAPPRSARPILSPPSMRMDHTRPPGRLRPSSSTTLYPHLTSCRAAAAPARPAPMMTIDFCVRACMLLRSGSRISLGATPKLMKPYADRKVHACCTRGLNLPRILDAASSSDR
mmetsp:Transcript_12797/g.31368  ORF Transcript_12797/g.31368 Transcript_12797/m.31368 type:complete len:211 (-) Transcript_12797:341-973(-)